MRSSMQMPRSTCEQRHVGVADRSIPADASDRNAVKQLVSTLTRLDVLINNAGVVYPDPSSTYLTPVAELQASLLGSAEDAWENTFRINVEAPFYLAASVLHLLAAAPDAGRIINISSIGSVLADPLTHQPAYQASKAAVNHLTRLLASKFRDTGIRVNAICEDASCASLTTAPGYFPSEMNNPNNPKGNVARAGELVPVKRAGQEEDVAGTAIWLSSKAGSYVNGQVIHLGGGREWA